MTSELDESVPSLLFLAMAGVAVSIQFVTARRRRREMQSLATGQLQWQDQTLPAGFPLRVVADMLPWYILGNNLVPEIVVTGPAGDDLLLAFDVTLGGGRNKTQITVVARRSTRLRPMPAGHPAYFLAERRDWRIVVHRPGFWSSGLLHTETIQLLWHALE